MNRRNRNLFFKVIVILALFALGVGITVPATAKTDNSKATSHVSGMLNGVSIYLPMITKNYDSTPPTDWDIIMQDNFEGDFPGVWAVQDNTSSGYEWNKRYCTVSTRTSNVAWAVGGGTSGSGLACGSHYANGVDTWMIYGPFSLVDYTQAELLFDRFLNIDFGDEFKWLASTDGSTYHGGSTYAFESWDQYVFDLTAVPTLGDVTGESQVWIAFVFQSNSSGTLSHGVYVDNVILQACDGSCTPTTTSNSGLKIVETSDTLK